MAEGSFDKLPKWAQEKIVNLQRTVAEKDADIKKLTGKTPVDEAYVLVETNDVDVDMPFPRHTGVRFVLTPKTAHHRAETVDAAVLIDRQGFRYLRLLGDRAISIAPTGANGIEIRLL